MHHQPRTQCRFVQLAPPAASLPAALLIAAGLASAGVCTAGTMSQPEARVQSAPLACLAKVEKLLRSPETVEAQFSLQKKTPGIKRVLTSRGRVVVSPGRGLIWQVAFPYEALSVFGLGKIGRTDEMGNYAVKDAPQSAQVLETVAHFDAATLVRDFFVACSEKTSRLQVVLTPKSSTYASFLTEAVLELDDSRGVITRLSFSQPSGAVSHIGFSHHKKNRLPSGEDGALLQSVQ